MAKKEPVVSSLKTAFFTQLLIAHLYAAPIYTFLQFLCYLQQFTLKYNKIKCKKLSMQSNLGYSLVVSPAAFACLLSLFLNCSLK